jgi:hypothetical protein
LPQPTTISVLKDKYPPKNSDPNPDSPLTHVLCLIARQLREPLNATLKKYEIDALRSFTRLADGGGLGKAGLG